MLTMWRLKMGTTDPVVAIVERMMEQLQKDNPGVDFKRKVKPKIEKPKPTKLKKPKLGLH